MKYDCTKARDFLHEVARSSKSSRCTDIFDCDNCPNSFTRADGSKGCIAVQRADSKEYLKMSDKEFSNIVNALQKWSDSHPEKRELTEGEVTVLKAMIIIGNKYIARDYSGEVFSYREKPKKSSAYWDPGANIRTYLCRSLFYGIVSYDDEEPAEIEELLK